MTKSANGRSRSSSVARPGEHQVTAFLRSRRELREQARFADSRLSTQPDDARGPALNRRQRALEHPELVPALYESGLRRGHDRSVTRVVATLL